MRRSGHALVVALFLGACMMGPNYTRSANTPVMAAWRDVVDTLRDASYANLSWWKVFEDTVLQQLVRRALSDNRDLHIAIARVNEARALLGIQRLEAYPQIDVQAGSRRSGGADSLFGSGSRTLMYLSPGLSWEVDLWGRLRRLDESSLANLRATEQDRRGVIMTVVSDVARAYLELLDLDRQLAIADTQTTIRRRSLELARARFQGGLTSELDVQQGENALAIAEGIRSRAARLRTQKENELGVLTGHAPQQAARGLPLDQQQFGDIIPAGLPSELLERRPDIKAAEERVRSANARIGAAIAALFPTLSLTAAGGTVSNDLDQLFHEGTGYWSLATNLFQPIIDQGRNRQQVAAERARTEAAVGQYEKTVLTAFQEVEDGLVAVRRLREETLAAARSATAARRAVSLAGLRYSGGVDNYLNLLDAQRAQLDAELLESDLQKQQRVALVQLYKALGGGWDPVTDTLALPGRKVTK